MELPHTHLLYGERLRRENRRVGARAQLRAAHVVLRNPEIGARRFVSPRTVESHLKKLFMKLADQPAQGPPRRMPTQRPRSRGSVS